MIDEVITGNGESAATTFGAGSVQIVTYPDTSGNGDVSIYMIMPDGAEVPVIRAGNGVRPHVAILQVVDTSLQYKFVVTNADANSNIHVYANAG